ncbi:MAG TPA: alpha-amylase, partial [Segetibacter sp.]
EKFINHIVVTNSTSIVTGDYNTLLLLFEVQFESGLAESYQLPITFAKSKLAQKLGEYCPESVIANITVGNSEGLLVDALYTADLQQVLIEKLAANDHIKLNQSTIEFRSNKALNSELEKQKQVKSQIHTEDGFTSIWYDNGYILKMYRKVDPTTNPDVEITQYLSDQANFPYVPAFSGAIEWKFERDTISLGMLQVLVENHGDGYSFMLTRINNFIERILAGNKEELLKTPLLGSLTEPLGFEELSVELQEFLGTTASEQIRMIGVRTGEMHLALASGTNLKDFAPEDFSLHYQRSLFSSMQTTVRETFQFSHSVLSELPDNIKSELEEILSRKEEILILLKRIYAKKLDVLKIRIHGNFHLGQVLLTGKDITITDFGGDPIRSFSDRRLKRSPLRDVAAMIRSIRYVAYDGFLETSHVQKEEIKSILPFARIWAHYISGFFMRAYIDTVKNNQFIPTNKEDLQMMLDTYMLEKSMHDLNAELKNKGDSVIIPLRSIKAILD